MSETQTKQNEGGFTIFVVVMLVGIAGLIAYTFYKDANTPENRSIAYCEKALKEILKSPSSYNNLKTKSVTSGEMVEVGLVYEASNSYGAQIKGEFSCTIKVDGRYLSLEEAKQNGVPLDTLTMTDIFIKSMDEEWNH